MSIKKEMKFLGFDKVLCLSPHPDDVEYAMAGTILKYTDTHFDIVCMTQGGDCDDTTNLTRLGEVDKSWNESNANNYELFFTPYKFLKELSSYKIMLIIANVKLKVINIVQKKLNRFIVVSLLKKIKKIYM